MDELLSIGQRIGAYTVRSLIETRGGSPVWRAEDARGASWALKLVTLPHAAPEHSRQLRERFDLLCAIQHPNLVQLKELIIEDRAAAAIAVCVMEFVYGKDVQRYGATAPSQECFTILQQVLSALESLHAGAAGGVISLGGFTPQRILRQDNGTVKLLTWSAHSAASEHKEALTPGWHSPERLQGFATDARADLYSAGALLHFLLTGKAPFAGRSIEEFIERKIEGPLDAAAFPQALAGKKAFTDLLAWIEKSLHWQAAQRYGSALEMLRELRRIENMLYPQAERKKAGRAAAVPVILLGSAGAGKTSYLAALLHELGSAQSGAAATVIDPDQRAALERNLVALYDGSGPRPTPEEDLAPVEISLRAPGRNLGPIAIYDSAGRHYEHLANNAPTPLRELLRPPCGLLLLLNAQQLNTAENAAAEISMAQSALDGCIAQLKSQRAKQAGGKLKTPLAIVLLERAAPETPAASGTPPAAASDDSIAHAEHFVEACRRKFHRVGWHRCRLAEPKTLAAPLLELARGLRPGLIQRTLSRVLLGAALLLVLLGGYGVMRCNSYRRIMLQFEHTLDKNTPPQNRLEDIVQIFEAQQAQISALQTRQLLEMIDQQFTGELNIETYQLQALHQTYQLQNGAPTAPLIYFTNESELRNLIQTIPDRSVKDYPASKYFAEIRKFKAKWKFLPEQNLYRSFFAKLDPDTAKSIKQNRDVIFWTYKSLLQLDEAYQLEYLKQVEQPAFGSITAPAALEYFRGQHPWSDVRQNILAAIATHGPGWKSTRNGIDTIVIYLQPFDSAGIAPDAEAAAWLRGFEQIARTREQLAEADRQRDARAGSALLSELQQATATLPNATANQINALKRAYEDWLALDWERKNLADAATRRTLSQTIAAWLERHAAAQKGLPQFLLLDRPGGEYGFLYRDAESCGRLLAETLKSPRIDFSALRLRIDEWQLTKVSLAWKTLFDLAWSEQIAQPVRQLRELIPELNKGYLEYQENAEKFRPVPGLYFALGEGCRKLGQWREEAEGALGENIDAIFDQRTGLFCRNYLQQLEALEQWPVISGTLQAQVTDAYRCAVGLTQLDAPLQLTADSAAFSRDSAKFEIPAGPVDWTKPLRCEALLEVDDWGTNTFYRAETKFDLRCPLVLIFLDQSPYRLDFAAGEYATSGTLTFGENFSLPWLLDPNKPLPRQ